MLMSYKRGQASVVLRVKILDSSVTTGAGLTGLTSASSGLRISTIADNEASATAYTVAGSTIETITTLGTYAAPTATKCRFKEVDSTNHKGVYEIQIADARFAVSSAKSLIVSISGATNAAETDVVIPLQDMDPYDAVRAGLTALPNANAAASGGLLTYGSSAGQLNPSSGKIPATVAAADVSGNPGVTVNAYGSGQDPATLAYNASAGSFTTSGTMGAKINNLDAAITTRLAAGNVTVGALASGVITSSSIASGALTSAAFASGAITSSAIASGAITSSTLASGAITSTAMSATALDSIVIETGVNMRQAIALIASADCGHTTGVDSGAPNFYAVGNPGTLRMTGSAANGNRTTVTVYPPA